VLPVAEASLISAATSNIKRDYKKTVQIAALMPVVGLMLGVGIAVLRELLGGRVFLTSKSVQSRLRVPCIGLLPKIRQGRRTRSLAKQAPGDAAARTIRRGDRGIGWTVVDYPFSQYSEGIRSVKLAIDMDNRSKSSRVIGLTSSVPGEGKSTVAVSVAQLIASNGVSVVLVDCDIRNPSLTRSLAPAATKGIVEVAFGKASLSEVVWKDPSTQLAFLPAIPHIGPPDPPSVLMSGELRRLFDELRNRYQFVVVDLSPLAPVIDVCATSEFIDSYVFVIEYGKTTVDRILRTLRSAPVVLESMIGAVLNKADLKTLATYDAYMTSYYFNKDDG
jgi:polysaccharide biosynthesis transport protein